ncbi:MAG: hypothetical protein ABEJ55_02210 [Halanaeroarchaeum sp.]
MQAVAVDEISPLAWRLLRVAAGYDQRGVEREVEEVMQAHISLLESGNRALTTDRLNRLFELYTEDLSREQVRALVEHF